MSLTPKANPKRKLPCEYAKVDKGARHRTILLLPGDIAVQVNPDGSPVPSLRGTTGGR